ncbi:MAG: phosphoesterase, partial [Lachnospiraceae bacterium]|nr:phosphoesterase [Lachnospiraceae bacterium]
MKRYISDQHFYDADVMRDLDHRPFHNAEEMNEYMILQWNDTVKNDDEIYIIGDMFSWSGTGRDPEKLNAVL